MDQPNSNQAPAGSGEQPSAASVVEHGTKREGADIGAEIEALKARVAAAEAKVKAREVEAAELQDENRRLYGIVKETALASAKPQPARRSWGLLMDE